MIYSGLCIEERAMNQASLDPASPRFALIKQVLRRRLSHEQTSGTLRNTKIPRFRDAYV